MADRGDGSGERAGPSGGAGNGVRASPMCLRGPDVGVRDGRDGGPSAGGRRVVSAVRGNDAGRAGSAGGGARGVAAGCVAAAARTQFAKRSERAMGWLLICLTGMYRTTLEAKYLDGCAPIVEQALAWQAPEGHWPNPIPECDRSPKCVGGKP